MKILSLFRNVGRAQEIVSILFRYGFDDLLTKIETPRSWIRKFVPPKTEGLNTWQRARRACEDLGPTFVKFAQLLSTRPDVLPQPLIEELKQLRDQVRPEPFEAMQPVLEQELGGAVENHFDDLNRQPIASGSLGQIYQARLKETGERVAIKVQRPDIKKDVVADLEIIGWLARQAHEKIEELRPYDLPAVMEETRDGIFRELDFTNEANHAGIFNSQNPFPEQVFAPRVFEAFTTPRLLVTEWVDGRPPARVQFTVDRRRKLASAGGNSLFHQIVISGFFHADPHSGNILITSDQRICLLDWGLVGQLTRFMRYFLADLLAAIAAQDAEKIVRVASRMSRSNRFIDVIEMEKQVTIILRKYQQTAITGEAIGKLILEMLYIFGRNGINVTKDFTLLAKSVASIEETMRALDPKFNLEAAAKPFLEQLAYERWNPKTLLRESYWSLYSALARLGELPGDLQRLIRRFENQDLSVKLHHEGVERLDELMSSSTNRLVLAIIIGALIIGSSMIISANIESPSRIGWTGFFVSGILGLFIVFDILRHGRHK